MGMSRSRRGRRRRSVRGKRTCGLAGMLGDPPSHQPSRGRGTSRFSEPSVRRRRSWTKRFAARCLSLVPSRRGPGAGGGGGGRAGGGGGGAGGGGRRGGGGGGVWGGGRGVGGGGGGGGRGGGGGGGGGLAGSGGLVVGRISWAVFRCWPGLASGAPGVRGSWPYAASIACGWRARRPTDDLLLFAQASPAGCWPHEALHGRAHRAILSEQYWGEGWGEGALLA